MKESSIFEKKSLRFLKQKNPNWKELAKDCVSFANTEGGTIVIGVEDTEMLPPIGQVIQEKEVELIRKQISYSTLNVSFLVSLVIVKNDSQYIQIVIEKNHNILASTSDGRYYYRNGQSCKAIQPEDLARMFSERSGYVWEAKESTVSISEVYENKKRTFINNIRNSDRISEFIREKSDNELLEYYFLQSKGYLTNLGILWIGQRHHRALMQYPPSIQVIRYNAQGDKIWKLVMDEYYENPKELLERVIKEVPDWEETIEISDGIFRKNIPIYPIPIIRELVVNALVHRSYAMRGDIFIRIKPDTLEIESPGSLPMGVTPQNILSQTKRRNEHLAKVFYDLGLMEKEGSGYDEIYSLLLMNGKPIPKIQDQDDKVVVSIQKNVISKEVVQLMDELQTQYNLSKKQLLICGVVSQEQSLSFNEIGTILNLSVDNELTALVQHLSKINILKKTGNTRGTQYSINPILIKELNFKVKTTLKNIENHRLEELIYKDISSYPNSSFAEIHQRIGEEINPKRIKRFLREMVLNGKISIIGMKRWARYTSK
ncbi:MAG: putative DNA binding domain-containing protein [Candidatus Kapabacteria bacterium]|nr:putative DNA binding domain-containing protein [Candidatus Kapabacteria bacterium]